MPTNTHLRKTNLATSTYFIELAGYLDIPDVDAFVEGAAGEELAVGTEGDAVDGLLVLRQAVNILARLDVPQANRRVERRAARHEWHEYRTVE